MAPLEADPRWGALVATGAYAAGAQLPYLGVCHKCEAQILHVSHHFFLLLCVFAGLRTTLLSQTFSLLAFKQRYDFFMRGLQQRGSYKNGNIVSEHLLATDFRASSSVCLH